MKKIKVRGYSYTRNGKTIKVNGYTRSCEGAKSSGEELARKKQSEGIVPYADWEEFQDAINEVGWENMTLTKGKRYKTLPDGRKTLHISDPRRGDPENHYIGFRQGGKLVGAANIYVNEFGVEIGDFEIFPKYKGKGYGKKFFNAIRRQHPKEPFLLRWGNQGAKKFWTKMGFKPTHGQFMEL